MDNFLTVITSLDEHIQTLILKGVMNLQDPLLTLLGTLAVIAIAANWEMYFSHSFNWGSLIIKILQVGFFSVLISQWPQFIGMIYATGEKLGTVAAGVEEQRAYTDIITQGLSSTFKYLEVLINKSNGLDAIIVIIVGTLLILAICYGFYKIAFKIFIIKNEFWIVGGLSIVLLPFAVTQWTKSISEKPWGVLLTAAVKLMVATFLLAVFSQYLQDMYQTVSSLGLDGNSKLTDENTRNTLITNLFTTTITIFFMAMIIDQATEFAGAMTNGLTISSPTLGAMAAPVTRPIGGAMSAGRTAYNMGKTTGGVVKKTGSKVGEYTGMTSNRAGGRLKDTYSAYKTGGWSGMKGHMSDNRKANRMQRAIIKENKANAARREAYGNIQTHKSDVAAGYARKDLTSK